VKYPHFLIRVGTWLSAGLVALSLSGCGPSSSFPDEVNGLKLLDFKPIEVVPGVYTVVGATERGTFENKGLNNNLSFIVTNDGVMVVNGGDNNYLARSLHRAISKVTDQPVNYVVSENGQGHAINGNSYWQDQGAIAIIHEKDKPLFEKANLDGEKKRMKEYFMDTRIQAPNEWMTGEKKVIQLGDTEIQLWWFGPAHSPGGISVFIPSRDVMIAGDIAFYNRMIALFDYTTTKGWVESFARFEKKASQVNHIIPGHGAPTDLATVKEATMGYITYMRDEVFKRLDEGEELDSIKSIDQSKWKDLKEWDALTYNNANRIWLEMEME
jgi:glyoxylase-like metal-dependent hydrolase (beta-lactamase superfamily II)